MVKVLVAAPTYNGMKYCQDVFLDRLKELDSLDYDILIVDNSRDNVCFEELKKVEGITILKDETDAEKNIWRLISSRNKIIKYALDNDYSHILMMDSDVIPPKNIISELLGCNKEIVSGLYFNYFGVGVDVKFLPGAWKFFTEKEFEQIKVKYPLPSLVKSRFDLRRHLTKEEWGSGELLDVAIPSAGCMLMERKVFGKIRYGKLNIPQLNVITGDDIYFITKAREAGFTAYCYTKIKCEHLVKGKYKKDAEGNLVHFGFTDN
jgi:GT2 family glycosyltransferase